MKLIVGFTLSFLSATAMANMSMMHAEMEKPIMGFGIDYLEWQKNPNDDDFYHWDINAEVLSGNNRFEWVSEGRTNQDTTEESIVQAIYRRGFSPFWDWQLGMQSTIKPFQQNSALIGVVGILPYNIELDSYVLLADDTASLQVKVDYELLLTQQLLLMFNSELLFNAQNKAKYNEGAGLSAIKGGFRLAYKHWLVGAPYMGLQWQRYIGNAADNIRASHLPVQEWVGVIGLTLHY